MTVAAISIIAVETIFAVFTVLAFILITIVAVSASAVILGICTNGKRKNRNGSC